MPNPLGSALFSTTPLFGAEENSQPLNTVLDRLIETRLGGALFFSLSITTSKKKKRKKKNDWVIKGRPVK